MISGGHVQASAFFIFFVPDLLSFGSPGLMRRFYQTQKFAAMDGLMQLRYQVLTWST